MSHITDDRKKQQGLWFQEQAKAAFDASDFEEAFHLYKEAERLYREAFSSPGSRVFFMQSTALRCLEELSLAGRADSLARYQTEAVEFFQEWTDEAIVRRILPAADRADALSFLVWRKSFLGQAPDLSAANSAVKRSDFDAAREILDGLIARLQQAPFPESDALLAIARSKREMLAVQEEFGKREDQRNLQVMVQGYRRAAEASTLPAESNSRQRARIDAFRDWFLSCSLKFEAFDVLQKETDRPQASLERAEELFQRAAAHAARALAGAAGQNFPRGHLEYLRFWVGVSSERVHLFKFMVMGEESEFVAAKRASQQALDSANWFAARNAQGALFPNRFYSLEDLTLEGLFLDASRLLRNSQWESCAQHLERWLNEFPVDYWWSWRYLQVRIRFLVCTALSSLERGDRGKLNASCTELRKLAATEPIGNTGRLLVAEVSRLQRKQGGPLPEDLVELVRVNFPLDAYTSSYETEHEINPILSFRERIYDWLDQARSPSTATELLECRAKLAGAVEALLGQIVDYHLQVLRPEHALPPAEIGPLIETLISLARSSWPDRSSLPTSLEALRTAMRDVDQANTPKDYRAHYDVVRGALEEVSRLVPVGIEIRSTAPSKRVPGAIEVIPDWVFRRMYTGRELLFLTAGDATILRPGWYYLPPAWRKGNRLTYRVTGRQPLLPVRFEARWDVWAWEAANASHLLIEGVTLSHLEQAIGLAERCRPEDDRVHPLVGALILRDGKEVARAYRNEDGKGGHAEWIAIQRAKDPKKLRGATLITTMEPCWTGRHTQNLPCARLVVHFAFRKVIIGIPDPNPDIRGQGDQLLRVNGIDVAYFPSNLSKRLWNLNAAYVRKHTNGEYRPVYLPR